MIQTTERLERAANRLVPMLKQTYKLTGFIPSIRFHGRGGGRLREG